METRYIPLDVLAVRLGLSRPFLRKQADNGGIPCLRVNGRLRFDEDAVCEALRFQAAQPSKEGATK